MNITSSPQTTDRTIRNRRTSSLLAGLFGAALFLSACGGDPAPIAAAAAPDTPAATDAPVVDAPAAAGPVAVTAGESPLGDILIGANGLTVYGFTNDNNATSACYGTCADAWPPVIVGEDWTVAPGLDSGIFNAVARDDGQLQLVAGKWPLYYFAGDTVSTDINGQGSGDVWFVVGTDGALITDGSSVEGESTDDGAEASADPAIVAVGQTSIGDALIDDAGLTLYGFLDDTDGIPTCDGACADAWPPVLLDSAELPAGLDANIFSVSERSDGSFQLNAGVWPLYRFAGDGAPGDVNGQGSGDVWFVATPDGGLIRDGGDEAAAAPASDDSESDDY